MTSGESPAPSEPAVATHALVTLARYPSHWALLSLPAALIASQLSGAIVHGVIASINGGDDTTSVIPMLAGVAGVAFGLMLLSWVLVLAAGLSPGPTLGLTSPRGVLHIRIEIWLAAAAGTFMLGPFADLLMSAMAELAPSSTMGNVPMLQDVARNNPIWLTWPFLALLPGIAEELYFRGLIQRSFARPVVGACVSAVAFAAFHLDPHHMIGVLPLGAFLSWVAIRHGTAVTMFAHIANNTVALLSARSATLDIGYGTDQPMPFAWIPFGLVIVALCVRVLRAGDASVRSD